MTEWLRRQRRVTVVEFARSFMYTKDYLYEGEPTAGFGFPCDEEGNVTLPPEARENYEKCLTGIVDGKVVEDFGVERREHSYIEPGAIVCVICGGEVELGMVMTNTCDACITCGQIEDFSWHKMTAEECEAWMQAHEGKSCARASEHHEYRPCNTDYNSSGQRLAPRSQWGWDTGESLGEILASDWPVDQPREAYVDE